MMSIKHVVLSAISIIYGASIGLAQEAQAESQSNDDETYFAIGGVLLIMGTFIGMKLVKTFPKKDSLPSKNEIRKGSVKWFNPQKGFGFIQQDNGEDLFVHQSEIKKNGFRVLNKDDRVEFRIGKGKKGLVAKEVQKFHK